MPLHLRPLTALDALSWTRIRSLAYRGPTHNLLHTVPISESSIRGVAQDRKKELGKPNTWHWKIVDTDLPPSSDDPADNGGRTIAIAVWSMVNAVKGEDGDGSAEPTTNPAETDGGGEEETPFLPPELRLDALNSLLSPLREAQKEIMGDRTYFMLNSLATHPEQQGRGAARMLLDWGLEKADEEGLVTYLDTSKVGRPIYERRGFRLVRGVRWDRGEWEGEGVDWHGCMVREPQGRASREGGLGL